MIRGGAGTPRCVIRTTRDRAIDGTRGDRILRAVHRWAPGTAIALGLAVAYGWIARMDDADTIRLLRQHGASDRGAATKLRSELAALRASSDCSSIFYLVEASSPEQAARKLEDASRRLAGTTYRALEAQTAVPR